MSFRRSRRRNRGHLFLPSSRLSLSLPASESPTNPSPRPASLSSSAQWISSIAGFLADRKSQTEQQRQQHGVGGTDAKPKIQPPRPPPPNLPPAPEPPVPFPAPAPIISSEQMQQPYMMMAPPGSFVYPGYPASQPVGYIATPTAGAPYGTYAGQPLPYPVAPYHVPGYPPGSFVITYAQAPPGYIAGPPPPQPAAFPSAPFVWPGAPPQTAVPYITPPASDPNTTYASRSQSPTSLQQQQQYQQQPQSWTPPR